MKIFEIQIHNHCRNRNTEQALAKKLITPETAGFEPMTPGTGIKRSVQYIDKITSFLVHLADVTLADKYCTSILVDGLGQDFEAEVWSRF